MIPSSAAIVRALLGGAAGAAAGLAHDLFSFARAGIPVGALSPADHGFAVAMVARVLLSWPALSLLAAGAFVGYAEAPRHVRATGALVVLDIMWIAALAGSLVVALVAPHPGPPQTAPLAMPIATAARLAGVGGAL